MKKKLFITLCILAVGIESSAQSFDEYRESIKANYEKFRKETNDDFEAYRKKINADYADFMRKAWSKYNTQEAKHMPTRPEPVAPVVKNPDEPTLTEPRPLVVDAPPTKPISTSKPTTITVPQANVNNKPIDIPEIDISSPHLEFSFYGTPCHVSADESYRYTLGKLNNDGIADAWVQLSTDKYYDLVNEMVTLRHDLNLCDWGYVRLVEKMTTTLFSTQHINEARVMQMFILTQSGYKVRMAQSEVRILLLLPFADNSNIYEYMYVLKGNIRYYILDKGFKGGSLALFDKEFPNEQYVSLLVSSTPALKSKPTQARHYASKRYPTMSVELSLNRNLIDFYNEYPLSDAWNMYVLASISEQSRKQMYAQLRKHIADKSKNDAADMLLNFVQTAFEYEVDDTQFGKERPLFGDETLFYPYSDCEDRSILYAILVRELLGLDVVLLEYPMHLATAVCFGNDITGRYITHNGKRYFVCDPTYIGASIGEAMPLKNNDKINVIEIK